MGKKKTNTGKSVTISIADIVDMAPKGLELPSEPNQGIYEKNSARFGFSDNRPGRKFYKNFLFANGPENTSFSPGRFGPKGAKAPTVDFSDLKIASKTANASSPRSSVSSLQRPTTFSGAPQTQWRPKTNQPAGASSAPYRAQPEKKPNLFVDFKKVVSNPSAPKESPSAAQSPAGTERAESGPSAPREERPFNPKPLFRSKTADGRSNAVDWSSIKKIAVMKSTTEKAEKALKPIEKAEKEAQPTEKAAQPTEKAEKAAQPTEKAAQPTEKALKPTEKAEKAAQPTEKAEKATQKEEIDPKTPAAKETEAEKTAAEPAGDAAPAAKKPVRKLAFDDLKKLSQQNKREKETDAAAIKAAALAKEAAAVAPSLAALIKTNSGDVRKSLRARRAQTAGGDVLSSLTEKQLRREAEEARRESEERAERGRRAKAEAQKRVAGLLATNRWEKVEFFGYFKGDRGAVDAELWETALKTVYRDPAAGLDAEFEKLTVWCLFKNVLSFAALSGAVPRAALPFAGAKGAAIFSAEAEFVAFLVRVLALFAEHFGQKRLRDYVAAEGADLALFFRLAPAEPLGEFLAAQGLAFLAPKEKIAAAVTQLLAGCDPCPALLEHLSSAAVAAEDLRAEPQIARLVGERVWRDCFDALGDAELAGAVAKRPEVARAESELSQKKATEKPRRQKPGVASSKRSRRDKYNGAPAREGAQGDLRKGPVDAAEQEPEAELAVEFYELKFELSEPVKLFFAPYIDLLRLLSGSSPAHQSELLNALALRWAGSGRPRAAAAGALRALFILLAADYEGVTEWRCWMPPAELAAEEAESLKTARRQLMVAGTEFLDVEMEEAHMLEVELKLKREEEESLEGESM